MRSSSSASSSSRWKALSASRYLLGLARAGFRRERSEDHCDKQWRQHSRNYEEVVLLLSDARVGAAIPCQDLERAKAWYKEKLGLAPAYEDPNQGAIFKFADGGQFLLFPSTGAPSGSHTQLSFQVDDLDAEIAELRKAGVVFEQYDFPGFKTDENGIADVGGSRGAFFKDSEGNLLAVGDPIE